MRRRGSSPGSRRRASRSTSASGRSPRGGSTPTRWRTPGLAGGEDALAVAAAAGAAAVVVALGSSAGLLLDALSGPSAEEAANLIYAATLTAVPVAMGIAVVRHRLFDIDLVLHRTLIYGVLTAILSGAYLATALLLGLALGGSDLAVAGATLAVAALFRPGRARVQAAADRRFHRSRYDAARTLNPFGARLRNEVDLDAVSAQLRAVALDALQPAAVSLRLRR